MVKSATEREARRDSKEAQGNSKAASKAAETGPLAEASQSLARGDVRTARQKLDVLAHGASPDDAAKARAISEGLGLDKAALAVAGAVLLVIAFAATVALFLRHG